MADITITINGIECKAQEGESILNIARANNIFIPAICFVPCATPTLACRLCMADADGKRVYTCNAKAKEGMTVITSTPEIEAERRSIMEVYAVNHPLECGVCDKSGECELQNYVLEMGVNEQNFSIPNTHKEIGEWGLTRYDPSLCIVCERCVTVCKDKIGESALFTVPRGEELAVPKEYKETMPKEAFAVWNKMQKSLIGKQSDEAGDIIPCSDCGECSAVCPVGALISADFHYTTNAWELTKIPSANPHSSDCAPLFYEVKQASIDDTSSKIYRVTSDRDFAPLNRAARFGYDFENRTEGKDEEAFAKIVDFIRTKAKTILFNSFITNEEALILQKIKEKFSLKLVNEQAFNYQRFLKAMSKASGKSLYSGTLDDVRKSELVISVGSMIRYDLPAAAYAMNGALKTNKASAIYAHPIHDKIVQNYSKNLLQLNYKIGSEEAFLLLLLELFAPIDQLDDSTSEYIQSFHTRRIKKSDEGETVVQSSLLWNKAGLEDMSEKIAQMRENKTRVTLLIGEDIISHPRWENMAFIVGTLERLADIKAVIIPPETNTLGVALICDLDEEESGATLGYNRMANMRICALGNGELDMPSLNQQEGTFTNINKRVVPINAALPYYGYELCDIANALGITSKLTVDYTKRLPQSSGFQERDFDTLANFFDNAGVDCRGYALESKEREVSKYPTNYEDFLLTGEGDIAYRLNPVAQFNHFVNKARQTRMEGAFFASAGFLEARNLKEGDFITINSPQGSRLSLKIKIDPNIEGDFAYLPTFDQKLNVYPFFDGYRFAKFTIEEAGE